MVSHKRPQSLTCCASPGLQSGGAGFQTRGNARYIKFGALALVAASRAIPTFSADSKARTPQKISAPVRQQPLPIQAPVS